MTSSCPRIGPPLQLLPWLELLYTPVEVAASHRLKVISISLTRASRTERTAVLVATAFLLPFLVTREVFSLMMVLIGRHALVFRSRRKMPRLVPARIAPLLACSSANTSRPPRPELFCVQCWPPSGEENTPPHSLSFTTPTRIEF